MLLRFLSSLLLLVVCAFRGNCAEAIAPIPRVLPPEGLEIPAEVRTRLESRLATVKKRLEAVDDRALKPDVEVFTKAVELALLHREFYVERDFAKADWALDEASKRLDSLSSGGAPWTKATGLVVRGFRSSIDGSAQPYGLVIPKDHDFDKPCPLYIWLHGRGDKNTDLHFLQERATRPGQIAPANAIVVHPFGRHCVGWKHAGEIDVLEMVRSLRYNIDDSRIVLIGFSMGGAGAWHIGAHYTDNWVAVSPGAGFVDTARYQKIAPDRYPESYVQKLWGQYDVPGYVRNLFNTNVIAYSGELDKQREAAVIMEDAFQGEGRTLTHLVGPGVEHKYEPKTLEELLKRLDVIVQKGQEWRPKEIHLQTRTLRYPDMFWLGVLGLEQHWIEARVDAQVVGPKRIKVSTKNITALQVQEAETGGTVVIDGQEVSIGPSGGSIGLIKNGDMWLFQPDYDHRKHLVKSPGKQGPIDDAFMDNFVVITPSGKSKNAAFQAWADFELAHFRDRWRALMRAELPEVRDAEAGDILDRDTIVNLILWGDADSNSVIASFMKTAPATFKDRKWSLGGREYDGNRFVPALIYPRRMRNGRYGGYVVLNSGLTFREAHDRTNSQQNPKLPDWAIIDITQPPDANAPGRIHDADFFDENWQLKRQPKGP
jgi:hypothetical protein